MRVTAVAVCAALGLVLAGGGCGDDEDQGKGSATTARGTTTAARAPTPPSPPRSDPSPDDNLPLEPSVSACQLLTPEQVGKLAPGLEASSDKSSGDICGYKQPGDNRIAVVLIRTRTDSPEQLKKLLAMELEQEKRCGDVRAVDDLGLSGWLSYVSGPGCVASEGGSGSGALWVQRQTILGLTLELPGEDDRRDDVHTVAKDIERNVAAMR